MCQVSSVVLAIDPDTQCSGYALADLERVYAVGVVDTSNLGLRGMAAAVEQGHALANAIRSVLGPVPDRFVVEAQQIYGVGGVNANNLLPLAMVSGAAMAAGRRMTQWVRCPLPREWKGQLKKGQSHELTLEHYKLNFARQSRAMIRVVEWSSETQVVVSNPMAAGQSSSSFDDSSARLTIPGKSLKEVLDALGLALWGAKQRG